MSRNFVARHYDNPSVGSGENAAGGAGAAAGAASEYAESAYVPPPSELVPLIGSSLVDISRVSLRDLVLQLQRPDGQPFLYEGAGGAVYLACHLQRALKSHAAADDKLSPFIKALHVQASKLAQQAENMCSAHESAAHHPLPITFYCGTSGVLAAEVLVALQSEAPATDVVERNCAKLVKLFERTLDHTLPNEILYGRAGYMHSLLLVHNALSTTPHLPSSLHALLPHLQQCIDGVFDQIISNGVSSPTKQQGCTSPLMWEWHNKMYMGAAHGVTGILYMLMSVPWRMSATDDASQRARDLILGTLDYCCNLRLASGNFPSSDSTDPDYDPNDKLVQWCHGAPGLALACVKAYEVFKIERYLQVAIESAEVVWERGLLRKGVGLCHGIGGNAYVFLRLYEATGDGMHLTRACSFARFALEGPHVSELFAAPDEPSCLANGRAGFACFLADLLAHVQDGGQQQEGGKHKTAAHEAKSADAAAAGHGTARSSHRCSFPGMDV